MKAAAYYRKSTTGTDEDQVIRQEGSFPRQEAAIKDYAKRHGIEIVAEYVDEESGKSMRKRAAFLRMFEDAKSPHRKFDAVIFGEFDRFQRNMKEAGRYVAEFDDLGVKLYFTNLKNDGSMGDKIYMQVASVMAEEYSRELARKTIQGMVRKAKMGSWLGGTAPYGYRPLKGPDGKNALVVHEEEAAVVRTMFGLSKKGWGYKKIAKKLNEDGIVAGTAARNRKSEKNRNPDGKWGGPSIRAILLNPIYKGDLRWNKKARVDCFDWKLEGAGTVEIGDLRGKLPDFKKNGATENHAGRLKCLPEEMKKKFNDIYIDRQKHEGEWIVNEGAVPAIVSEKDFDAVQERFRKYKICGKRESGTARYFMTGLLRCGTCKNSFFGSRYSKIVKATKTRNYYEYYRCAGDYKKGSHNKTSANPMLKRESIDSAVVAGILKRTEAFADVPKIKALFENRLRKYFERKPGRLEQIEAELGKVNEKIERAVEVYMESGHARAKAEMETLNGRKKALEAERGRLVDSGQVPVDFNFDREAEKLASYMRKVSSDIKAADPVARRRIRDNFLERAEVDFSGAETMVTLQWRPIPEAVCAGSNSGRLHFFSANQDQAEDATVERYAYRNATLVLLEA